MIEFESKINTDFKKECIEAFEKALDECAYQHNMQCPYNIHTALSSDCMCCAQPISVSIKIEYDWGNGKNNKMYCQPLIFFNKKT